MPLVTDKQLLKGAKPDKLGYTGALSSPQQFPTPGNPLPRLNVEKPEPNGKGR